MTLRTAEVTARTGFSPATLRYYEEIGVLDPPARAANGYREYDERVVERLAFVARAKQLGCTLEEIRHLLAAWDDDCGDVVHQMRSLVDAKIAEAQRQTAELVAFTAQLQRVAGALREGAGPGACGDGCACMTTPAVPAAPGTPVEIACTLGPDSARAQVSEWQEVLDHVEARGAIDGGVRLDFAPAVPVDELARLARAEQSCCSFFSFALLFNGGGVALEIRAPRDAQPVLAALFGLA